MTCRSDVKPERLRYATMCDLCGKMTRYRYIDAGGRQLCPDCNEQQRKLRKAVNKWQK